MAIVTIDASKATPDEAIRYIRQKEKAALIRAMNMDIGRDLATQMKETARMWGKAQNLDDRKYYHLKLSFAPEDWDRNGGSMTPADAMEFGMAILREFWPTNESVSAVHVDADHLHFHGIINAVNMDSGKMIDMRDAQYRHLKDRVQEVCTKKGLNAIDWRQATKEKRERENQPEFPIRDTPAEQGMRERGEHIWKDDLRLLIDLAATTCNSLDEFVEQLQNSGITLTRCTENTISYKMGDHRAVRGDTLGADYTMEAISDAIAHNQALDSSLDDYISFLENGIRPIHLEERQLIRDIGRAASYTRMEVDEMCDRSSRATWDEKQEIWKRGQDIKNGFWKDWHRKKEKLEEELSGLYGELAIAKHYAWILSPRNRRSSFADIMAASAYFADNDSLGEIKAEIIAIQRRQDILRYEAGEFRRKSDKALEIMRSKGLSLDEYEEAIKLLQEVAEKKVRKPINEMTEQERAAYYVEQARRNSAYRR